MRSHRFSKCIVAVLTVAAALPLATPAEAQTTRPDLALNRFEPSFAGDRMFGVPSPYAAGHLAVHAALIGDYANNPLVLHREGEAKALGAIVSSQLFLHFNATFSLWNRLSFNLDAPLAMFQAGDSPAADGQDFPSPASTQFGDLRAGVRGRLFGNYDDPFQIGVGGYIWFPTGPSQSYVSDGTVRFLPQVLLGGRAVDRIVWSLALGPEIRPLQQIATTAQGTMLRWGAGVAVLLGDRRHLQLGAEFNGGFVFKQIDSRTINGELLGTVRYRIIDDVEVGLGMGPGLSSGIGTPDFRGVMSVAYTPEQKKFPEDRDKDGIADPLDACPDVPGVANDDPKKNGCPPSDRDKDGILDADDACPDVPGVANDDPKKNGCPPDSDADGILDADDACPDVKGVQSDDPKKNGCPPDRDGDGILDADDACPDVKGVPDPNPKKNGCPPPVDTDGDGIFDDEDACPNDKGIRDPDPTKNGCPRVRVSEQEVLILEQVQFDTGKATIKKVSDPLLDEVAGVLKEHPELAKIEVQGHTDDRGARAMNVALSKARAEAVMKALVKRGIAARRLTSNGYGPDKPIAPNDTEDRMQKNRRVQFNILEKKTPQAPQKAQAPRRAPAPQKQQPKKK